MLNDIKRERTQKEREYTDLQNKMNVMSIKASLEQRHKKSEALKQNLIGKIKSEISQERRILEQMKKDDKQIQYEMNKLQRSSIKEEEQSLLRSFRRSVSVQNMKSGGDVFRKRNEIKEFLLREKENLLNDRRIRVRRINEERNKGREISESRKLERLCKRADELKREYAEELKKRDRYLDLIEDIGKAKSSVEESFIKSRICRSSGKQ